MVATLLLTLVAAMTTTGSTLVALREDYITPQVVSLVDCQAAAGGDLASLDGRRTSPFRASGQLPPGLRSHYCRRCQKNSCQGKNRSPHGVFLQLKSRQETADRPPSSRH